MLENFLPNFLFPVVASTQNFRFSFGLPSYFYFFKRIIAKNIFSKNYFGVSSENPFGFRPIRFLRFFLKGKFRIFPFSTSTHTPPILAAIDMLIGGDQDEFYK